MYKLILLLFALFFTMGLYLVLAAVFHVPTYRATKAVLNTLKKNKKQASNSDAVLMELAAKLAKVLPMDDYKRRKLTATARTTACTVPATAGPRTTGCGEDKERRFSRWCQPTGKPPTSTQSGRKRGRPSRFAQSFRLPKSKRNLG